MEETEYDWPGWKLKDNPFGKEFDLEARKRMVEQSRKLLPLLEKWKGHLGDLVLEAGPFFHPLVNQKTFPGKTIVYWDNDMYVLNYLAEEQPGTVIQFCDLNKVGESRSRLQQELGKKFRQIEMNPIISSVVISHLFNYIDYSSFLREIREFLVEEGLVFINHSVNYGLPPFFSPQRPRSNLELLMALEHYEFKILEKKELPSPNTAYQPQSRLLVVAQKSGIPRQM